MGLVIASSLFYLLAVSISDSTSSTSANAPLKFILASSLGTLLLKLSYDVLVSKLFTIRTTLINPIAIGIISALPGAISLYYWKEISY